MYNNIVLLFGACYTVRLAQPMIFHKKFNVCNVVSHGVVDAVLDCEIVVSDFELQSRYYIHFWNNTSGKCMKLLIPLLCMKSNCHYSSTRMALAFNNPGSLMCHQSKETKSSWGCSCGVVANVLS